MKLRQAGDDAVMSLIMPFLAVLARELFGILQKLLAILQELFGELRTQWMFRLGIVHQRHERLND